jgi:hypothetical protein
MECKKVELIKTEHRMVLPELGTEKGLGRCCPNDTRKNKFKRSIIP